MSDPHSGQLIKEFVFGLKTTSYHRVSLDQVDAAASFYSLRALRSTSHTVISSPDRTISGLFLTYATEKGTKELGYMCEGRDHHSKLEITFARGEFINRLLLGFGEERSEAVELHTNLHCFRLGDIYESLYVADIDFTETDLAIVGFATTFNAECLSELSVYAAPAMSKASFVPLVKVHTEGISPAFVPEAYFKFKLQEKELKRDKHIIHEAFTRTKVMRRASTNKNL